MALRSFSDTQKDKEENRNNWKQWLPKTVLGATLFAFALSFQIKANHPQITYYLAIVIFAYAIGQFIYLCIDRERRLMLKKFFIASALLLTIGGIGIATNANKLIPTLEYTPYTMRGGSELTSDKEGHNNKGLDLEYATAWSYGIEEMPNLLIPNFNGGSSSGELPLDSETGKLLKQAGQPNLKQTMKYLPLYWGPQPFTAGPMYMGAITIFLFVLGILLCKGREKWWLIAASIITIFLAWGNHFMWFTELWFEYAPMYNKFRTVSMALIVLQTTMPLLGFYALDKILKGDYDKTQAARSASLAYVVTAGFCLVCWLMPGIAGSFSSSNDDGLPQVIAETLATDRATLLTNDALRSFGLITCVFALIVWALRKGKANDNSNTANSYYPIIAIAVISLVCIDLFSVGKRYLNKDHFVTPKDFTAHYEPRLVDELIHEDQDPNYRVLDLSVNTFNDAIQSYHHKCIGGYSPVKLQRYQDLIDKHITKEIRSFYGMIDGAATIGDIENSMTELKVVSMLNGKYIIVDPECSPVYNQYAYGNCWFADDFVPAATPDEEIGLISSTDLHATAIIGDDFAWARKHFDTLELDGDSAPSDYIGLTYYAPNELRYEYITSRERAAIFSEIYYPKGWKAWIEPVGAYGEVHNGRYQPTDAAKQIDLFRANWMLRGAIIPQGEGTLIMRFEPDSYQIGENVSLASSIILILLLIASAAGAVILNRKSN